MPVVGLHSSDSYWSDSPIQLFSDFVCAVMPSSPFPLPFLNAPNSSDGDIWLVWTWAGQGMLHDILCCEGWAVTGKLHYSPFPSPNNQSIIISYFLLHAMSIPFLAFGWFIHW